MVLSHNTHRTGDGDTKAADIVPQWLERQRLWAMSESDYVFGLDVDVKTLSKGDCTSVLH